MQDLGATASTETILNATLDRDERRHTSPFAQHSARSEIEPGLARSVAAYEDAYRIAFADLVSFSPSSLELLHTPYVADHLDRTRLEIASVHDDEVKFQIGQLTTIANAPSHSEREREHYFRTILEIYRKLHVDMRRLLEDPNVLVIAPQREGYLIAKELGWLPEGRSLAPSMKRIKYNSQMVVGVAIGTPIKRLSRCVIVDGAVASGATLMALMALLPSTFEDIVVLTAHAAPPGVAALRRFANWIDRNLKIHAGDVSGVLDEHFYAIQADNRTKQFVVGDLGDLIAGKVQIGG